MNVMNGYVSSYGVPTTPANGSRMLNGSLSMDLYGGGGGGGGGVGGGVVNGEDGELSFMQQNGRPSAFTMGMGVTS